MTDNKTYEASAIALNDDDLGGVTGGTGGRPVFPPVSEVKNPLDEFLRKQEQSTTCECTCEHCGKEQHTESTPNPPPFSYTPPSYTIQGTNPIPATQQFPFPGKK